MNVRVLACSSALWVATAGTAHAQLTIRLTGVPTSTPSGATIYVAGSFNGWNPASADHALKKDADGAYVITLPNHVRGDVEFKFTLGSWEQVEHGLGNADVANRVVTIGDRAQTYTATVAGWRSGPAPKRPSTARKTVSVINEAFEIPQLNRTRRVWIYLPPDYATSGKLYPVLYMHDGQNVFDDSTSFAGEWGVDETLDSLHAAGDYGVIVVAVDHGGQQRTNEYSPWSTRFGRGEGDLYVDFVALTLKPWIDQNYRTKVDRTNTGIGGSSMGGLISFYAALKYPGVFGRAAVFSPSFWIAPEIYDYARIHNASEDARFYILSGAQEGSTRVASSTHVRNQQRMVESLTQAGFVTNHDLIARIAPDGKHSEWFWRREFPAAYKWLFSSSKPK